MNNCQALHKNHETRVVNTIQGEMTVFAWNDYMNFQGYCTGQDEVSKSLDLNGTWDIQVYQRMLQILTEKPKEGLVMDIGCQIGWFSKLASDFGYGVKAYDGDSENLTLLKLNAPRAQSVFKWFDKYTEAIKWCGSCSRYKTVKLVKIDIEGNEEFAINFLQKYLEEGVIQNIIMEVTPVFNDRYPALVERVKNYGFNVYEIDGRGFDFNYNFSQKDLWFQKK